MGNQDAELPPIMEEEDESPEFSCSAPPAFMEESELDTVNDKAIVLFKPLNSPFLNSSSSNLSVSVDSDLISGFKGKAFSLIFSPSLSTGISLA